MKGSFHLVCLAALVIVAAVGATRAQNESSVSKDQREATDFRFRVKHDHLRKSCVGELVINNAGVEYLTDHEPHKRSWPFKDIRLLKLISAAKIEILTYQQRRLTPSLNEPFKLGSDESFKFELLEGEISPDLSEFLLERIKRPVVTTFVRQAGEVNPPLYAVPARHRHRWGGCNGELRVYDDKLIYESFEDKENSRLWRWSDIQGFGRSGRYKFDIVTFEPQFGGEKTFNFDLKEEITDEAYDFVWKKFYRVTYYAPARIRS